MKTSFVAIGATLVILFVFVGCKQSTSVENLPYYITPSSALDPEPSEEMVQHLLDSGTFHISGIQQKGNRITGLEDSLQSLVDFAVSKVSADAATHIPYVWGGKHIDRPTKWAKCSSPDSNAHCPDRIGLDCSGFVQYCFEQVGFGREEPELNVASLAQASSWDFMTNRGYFIVSLPSPKISELMPGDVLIFKDGNNLVHTGIFWKSDATINNAVTPAFINSAGRSDCDACYAKEARGELTGVVATPLTSYWEGRIFSVIRITGWSLSFSANGYRFFGGYNHGVAAFTLDTTLKILEVGACDSARACVFFKAANITAAGTYPITEREYDDYYAFEYAGDSLTYPDSLFYYITAPPTWWKGNNRSPTGGELKITGFSRGQYFGTITGTFTFKANSYYERYEDSTYMIDTVKHTTSVPKYYSKQTEVTGSFGGVMGYK